MTFISRTLAPGILSAAILTSGFAQSPGQPLTLQEAVNLALSRNPEVLVAQEQLEELKGRIKEVRSGAFPQISADAYGLRIRDPSILNSSSFDKVPQEFKDALVPVPANLFDMGFVIKQPIFTAGKVRTAVRLAEETQREKMAALEAVRQRVTFKVFQAFHDLLLADENLAVVNETYEQRKKHLEQARSRFSNGVATEIDVLRSEVNVANTEPELIRAQNRVKLARSALNNLIVVDLEAPTQIAGRLDYRAWAVSDLAQLQDRAMESRPEMMVARRQLQEARHMQSLANAENKLSIDFEGRWGYSVREPNNFFNNEFSRWNVTFNFRLPFYDSGRKAGLVAQALSRTRAAEHGLAQLENSVRLEIKSAFEDMQSSSKAIAAARLNVAQAERVLTMMQANYQHGAATTLDVVDSQTALTMARNTQIGATYDYEMAKARLRLAAGSPILDQEVNQP
ncbi:MAG TPA: TolC family protein [Acidobacteriota bacterium]|nr:TolC family protein [Acidobacteriota bacterium]